MYDVIEFRCYTVRVARRSGSRLIALTTAERITPLAADGDVGRWRAYAAALA